MRRAPRLVFALFLALALLPAARAAASCGQDDAPSPALGDADKDELLRRFFGKPVDQAQDKPGPRGWAGLAILPAERDELAAAGLSGREAVRVEVVELDAPGDKAGLAPGDILTLPGGEPLSPARLAALVAAAGPGGTVGLERWSRGAARAVALQVAAPPMAEAKKPGTGLPGLAAGIACTGRTLDKARRMAELLRAGGLRVRVSRYAEGPEGTAARLAGRYFVARGYEAEGEQAAGLVRAEEAFTAEPAEGNWESGPHFSFWLMAK